ncbi:hypothetical protein ACIRPT_27060 [Streptomyces sp. NPDC101227]|uniref:hypothetical protein n=1 Tax=Streptomyces sp. NPDC101227 TaxID=3366136 RepID=UPI003829AB3A
MKSMTGQEILTAVIPLFATLLTGAMGAVGILIKDRRNERSRDQRFRRQVEIGQAEIQFIHVWIKARQLLGPLGDDARPAQEWLDRCYASVTSSQEWVETPTQKINILRRLLLIRSLHGAAAQIWRVVYWLIFVGFNVYVITAVTGVVQWIQGDPEGADLVGGSLILAFLVAPFAATARFLAVRQDEVAQKPVAMPPRWRPRAQGWIPDETKQSAEVPRWPPHTPRDP